MSPTRPDWCIATTSESSTQKGRNNKKCEYNIRGAQECSIDRVVSPALSHMSPTRTYYVKDRAVLRAETCVLLVEHVQCLSAKIWDFGGFIYGLAKEKLGFTIEKSGTRI